MGYWKERQMEEEARGFKYPGEKFVCKDCFDNVYIKDYIKEYAKQKFCNYCGKTSDSNIAVHLEEIIEIIMDGIKSEYEDPRDSMGWESAEGRWQGAKVYDKDDLIYKYGCELGIDNDNLFTDITDSIIVDEWCEVDPYGLRENEMYFYDWKDFCKIAKHKMRYVFLIKQINKRNAIKTINQTTIIRKEKTPVINDSSEILFYIEDNINEIDIIKEINKDSVIYRGRTHKSKKFFTKASELGTPSEEESIHSNRMSPAGIPMFYGAMDTVEVYEEMRNDNRPYITIGKFLTLKKLKVIDFTKLPPIPTVFNPETRYLRTPLKFFTNFVEDLSKTIKKDNRKQRHIEYIPTQIITEYFRYLFKDNDNKNIDGILYPSSCVEKGVCCVLFIAKKECTDCKTEKDKKLFLADTINKKY